MKRTLTERKVLKRLGIKDFRHMTKDKVVKFATMLPYMDKEVAKAALQQFPEFKDMACSIIFQIKEAMDKTMDYNEHSQNEFYLTCNAIISSLQKELEKENITSEDRDRIEDKMILVAKMKAEKDSENKKFYQKLYLALGSVAAFTVVAATSFWSNSHTNNNDDLNDENSNDDDNEDNNDDNNDIIDV